MARKRHTTEDIIHGLHEAVVLIGQSQAIAEATQRIGVTDRTYFRSS